MSNPEATRIELLNLSYEPSVSSSLTVMRRGYEEVRSTPRDGEIVYKTLGQYAVYQDAKTTPWQLLPAGESLEYADSPTQFQWKWVTAEEIRTLAAVDSFPVEQMDLLEDALITGKCITGPDSRVDITDQRALRKLLREYGVDTQKWDASTLQDLYRITRQSTVAERENISLHIVDNRLVIASAQAMVNVFAAAPDGSVRKLRETWKTRYDGADKPVERKRSSIRSSMGETGHIINGRPERPYATALRGLQEELGVMLNDIQEFRSTGSVLRLKSNHHYFGPISAQDHTHYFCVILKPGAVCEFYRNEEKDPDGRLYEVVELEWSPHEGAII